MPPRWLEFDELYLPPLTIILFLLLKKKIHKREGVLFFYCLLSVVIYSIIEVLASHKIHNLFLYNIYGLFEVWVIGYYLILLIRNKPALLFYAGAGVYFLLWLCIIFFAGGFWNLNLYATASGNLVLIVLCMVYLLKLSGSNEIFFFQRLPSFWIVTGFFLSSVLMLMSNLSFQYFLNINSISEANMVFNLAYIAIIIKFVFISVGLLCYTRPASPHPSL